MSTYQPRQVSQHTRVQLFSFGSKKVQINDLIAILERLRDEEGCTDFEMNPPPQAEVGEISFYGVKQRPETTSEVLERNGLKDHADKVRLYNILSQELGQ